MLTLGATTRFIDPNTGAEGARFAAAQRIRFNDQQVTLPGGTPIQERFSDLLAGMSLNLTPKWSAESAIQYNSELGYSTQSMLGFRYTPAPYRNIAFAFRAQDDPTTLLPVSNGYDVSWQWPMGQVFNFNEQPQGYGYGLGEGRWYSVGRINYSRLDGRVLESVVGFEYDAGCWLGRIVSEQLQVTDGVTNKRLLFQLEFVGFSKLGTSALSSIRNNVAPYDPLRLPAATPSRFGMYE
jgi:LPS-assembly protein